jgi:hypothetical protein
MSRQRLLRLFTKSILPSGVLGGVTFGGAARRTRLDAESKNNNKTSGDSCYWEHDPKDFDFYITNPTAKDLPLLLHKFDVEGLDVWPWIWTHPNNDGPHYVFCGVNKHVVQQIREIRAASPQNNILIIAPSQAILDEAAGDDPEVYNRCHCGIVTDSTLELLNHEAKILMLKDERIVAFDYLIIS